MKVMPQSSNAYYGLHCCGSMPQSIKYNRRSINARGPSVMLQREYAVSKREECVIERAKTSLNPNTLQERSNLQFMCSTSTTCSQPTIPKKHP